MKREALGLLGVTQCAHEETILHELDLHVFAGELFGLFTLNTVGETALQQLLLKNIPLTRGIVRLEEVQVNSHAMSDGSRNAVFLINRNNELINTLSLAENVYIRGYKSRIWKNVGKSSQELDRLFREMHVPLTAAMHPKELTPCQRCLVELIQAVNAGGRLILLKCDFLSESEQSEFSRYLRFFSKKGITFLQFSTNYARLQIACTRIALMHNGRIVKIVDRAAFQQEALKPFLTPHDAHVCLSSQSLDGMFRMERVCTRVFQNYQCSISPGQCALFLYESSEEMRAMFQLLYTNEQLLQGRILLDGKPLSRKNRHQAVQQGLMLVDANPTTTMVCPSLSYLDNLAICLPVRMHTVLRRKRISSSLCQEYGEMLGPDLLRKNLFGLSHQSLYNLVYGRILVFNPKVVVIMQPLEGCELSLQDHLLNLIRRLKRQGIAVLLLSGSSAELLSVTDYTFVARKGRLVPRSLT